MGWSPIAALGLAPIRRACARGMMLPSDGMNPVGNGSWMPIQRRHGAVQRGEPRIGELIERVPVRPFVELQVGRQKVNAGAGAKDRLVVQAIGDANARSEEVEVLRLQALLRVLWSADEIDRAINRLPVYPDSLVTGFSSRGLNEAARLYRSF